MGARDTYNAINSRSRTQTRWYVSSGHSLKAKTATGELALSRGSAGGAGQQTRTPNETHATVLHTSAAVAIQRK